MHVTQRIVRTILIVLSGSIAAGSTSAVAAHAQDSERPAIVSESDSADAWSRVQRLAPGTPITVTAHGLPVREGHVVSVNESSVTVLNTANSTLPSNVQHALRAVAANHPEYLSGVRLGNTLVLNRSLSIQKGGVFLDGRKLASLSEILETTPRRDLGEIVRRQRGRGVWGHLGPLGGYFVGALSGGVALGLACRAARGTDRCDTGPFLTGMVIGGATGAGYGFHAARRETEVVVYRASAAPSAR